MSILQRRERRALLVTGVIVVAFVVCWVPGFVILTVRDGGREEEGKRRAGTDVFVKKYILWRAQGQKYSQTLACLRKEIY